MKEIAEKANSPKIIVRCELDVWKSTVERHLRMNNYNNYKVYQQVLLTKKHRVKRYKLFKEWIMKNHPLEITVFSDEQRFTGCGNKNDYIRQLRYFRGGFVNVWMMMMSNGFLSFPIIEGNLKYEDISLKSSIPIIKLNLGNTFRHE